MSDERELIRTIFKKYKAKSLLNKTAKKICYGCALEKFHDCPRFLYGPGLEKGLPACLAVATDDDDRIVEVKGDLNGFLLELSDLSKMVEAHG